MLHLVLFPWTLGINTRVTTKFYQPLKTEKAGFGRNEPMHYPLFENFRSHINALKFLQTSML